MSARNICTEYNNTSPNLLLQSSKTLKLYLNRLSANRLVFAVCLQTTFADTEGVALQQ